MEVTEIKVWPIKKPSNLKANGSLVVGNVLRLKFTVVQGKEGLFVGWPGKWGDKVNPETGKKPFYKDISFVDSEQGKLFNTELNALVLVEYAKATGLDLNQGEAPGPVNQSDGIPF